MRKSAGEHSSRSATEWCRIYDARQTGNDVTVCGLREATTNHIAKRNASEFNRRTAQFDAASSTVV
jgi:hypothetical protein